MRFWYKEIILLAILYHGSALRKHNDDEFRNIIIKDIMNKIEKIAHTLSNALIEKKPKMLAEIEAKLSTATKQAFGDEGKKYVELIMQGVRLKAFNRTLNVSKEIDTPRFKAKNDFMSESIVDEYQSSERIVKDHMAKQITDKIEAFAKMYMMKLKSSDDKRKFLENVRKKILEMAKTKHFKGLNHNDIVNYNEMITKSINVILRRNLEQSARRTLFSQEKTQNSSDEWLEYREDKNHDIENNELEKECIVSIAKACSEVKFLNKFTCQVNCSESDVINSTHQADKLLHDAKNTLIDMKQSFEENCLSDKINETRTYRNIISDLIKAQINVVSDFQDSFQPNKEIENNEETLKKVLDILNTIALNLSKGICSRQEKASGLVASARRFNQILNEDLEQIVKDGVLFPKSCVCDKDQCISNDCIKSCKNFCILHYHLGRWSCTAVSGNSSITLNAICDGKLDCYDESDESECTTGKGRDKFKANEAFLQIIKIFEMKMASKDYYRIRNDLIKLYNSVIKLQHLSTAPNPRLNNIRTIRNRCFALLSSIYGNFMRNSFSSYEAEEIYRFLYMVNTNLVTALKYSNTGNVKIISSSRCICKKNKCIMSKCSLKCTRVCSVESVLSRYHCKDSPRNRSIPVEAVCNGKNDCRRGDDEDNCKEEICRTHHLLFLRQNIQDVGIKRDGTTLGEILKFWRTKVTQMLLVAEKGERPTPKIFKQIVKDMLQDLVYAYASLDTSRRKNTNNDVQEFSDVAQRVINALKSCGK
ncbi:unnamed protein product [Parnassius mnemosyne]|uniref:Uncharacterized protein n=1 Tax=Parnassius mnemosyne TaxID=213953 RepID=A0AAV1KCM4_9NEOP